MRQTKNKKEEIQEESADDEEIEERPEDDEDDYSSQGSRDASRNNSGAKTRGNNLMKPKPTGGFKSKSSNAAQVTGSSVLAAQKLS